MNGISAKRYLWIFGLLAAGLAIAVALLNWRVDPLQFYRKAAYPPDFVDQARYQNPGLARNYPYDAVVIGTSVSLGFRADRIHDTLGWNAIDLAMPGASAHEQSLLLDVALRTGRVRHVLWDVNHEYLRGDPDWVSDYDGAFPAYFYDTNPWNEIPNYLLNIDTTKASIRVLLRRCGLHLYIPRSLDDLSRPTFNDQAMGESLSQIIRRARASSSPFQEHPEEFGPEKLQRSFEANYLRLIRAHPEVVFDLWFPPFSIARHAVVRDLAPEVWSQMFRWKSGVLQACAACPNVRLHDFQGIPEIVLDRSHYYGTLHFDESIRERILEAMANGEDPATSESLAETEAFLRREVSLAH